ncbi:MAG: hypothetical protein IJK89_00380 [Clostridia bacterium]|nr:hypothetical protein [Clostridia bacterium]
MTIAHAIARFDTLYPNVFPYAEKLRWLSALDGQIFQDIFSAYPENVGMTFDGYEITTDKQTALLVPFPHDDIYIKYLTAQCDKINSDVARYVNSAAVFNAAYNEFAAHYNRTHPAKKTRFTV